MRFVFLSKREWPDRRRASIHADAANDVLALASCSRNRDREFFLFRCPQEQSTKTSLDLPLGPRFLRIESTAVAKVPLPRPREKPGRVNPKHLRTHRLPVVP